MIVLKPVRFDFGCLASENLGKLADLVLLGEKKGYGCAWIPDMTFHRDVYVALTVCALRTKKISLGVGVTNPFTRHSISTAVTSATIDEISGGRLVLGIGSGNRRELLGPLGLEVNKTAERCREAVEVIRALLSGNEISYKGKWNTLSGVKLGFKPKRRLPIYVAGIGPRILHVAGEVADGAILGEVLASEGLRYCLERLKRGAEKARRRVEEIDIVSWVSCILDTETQHAITIMKPRIAHLIGATPMHVLEALGIEGPVISTIKNAYSIGGRQEAAKFVPDELANKLTMIGTPKDCARKVENLLTEGIRHISILLASPSWEDKERTLRLFSERVIPMFR